MQSPAVSRIIYFLQFKPFHRFGHSVFKNQLIKAKTYILKDDAYKTYLLSFRNSDPGTKASSDETGDDQGPGARQGQPYQVGCENTRKTAQEEKLLWQKI